MIWTPLTLILIGILCLLGVGFYGLLISRNLIKVIVALQILGKAALIAFVLAGNVNGQTGLGQALAMTVIASACPCPVCPLMLPARTKAISAALPRICNATMTLIRLRLINRP